MQPTPPPAPALRPLGVGDVLDRTFTVYRGSPWVFIGLSAIWYLALVIVIVVLAVAIFAGTLASFAQSGATTGTLDPNLIGSALAGLITFVIVTVIVALLIVSAQSGSLIRASALRYLGKETSIGEAFNAGVRATLPVFGVFFLTFAAILAFWGILAIVGAIANQGIVLALAVLAGIVGTFYLIASWYVAPVIAIAEGAGPLASMGRAWGLSDGNRWRIIAILIMLFILNIILSILIGALFGFAQTQEPGVGAVVQLLVNLGSTIIWAPVQWIACTVLYYDLRVRKEAFDLQLAAEALPQS